jgi:hypothetical protein
MTPAEVVEGFLVGHNPAAEAADGGDSAGRRIAR